MCSFFFVSTNAVNSVIVTFILESIFIPFTILYRLIRPYGSLNKVLCMYKMYKGNFGRNNSKHGQQSTTLQY